MLLKVLTRLIATKLMDKDRFKKREEKKRRKESMIKLFGKTRYYLALWFGQWVYFTWNTRDYQPVLYQKFYSAESSAMRYAERLKHKYTIVDIQKVYDKRQQIGFMIYGKGKKIAQPIKLPSNVINFSKYHDVKNVQ